MRKEKNWQNEKGKTQKCLKLTGMLSAICEVQDSHLTKPETL